MGKKAPTVMLTLRIPAELRARLEKAGQEEQRSVNSLVTAILSQASIMQESEKAWLACALDGEGSIFFVNRRNRRGLLERYVHLVVCNTDMRFITEAARLMQSSQIYTQNPQRVSNTKYAGKKLIHQVRQRDREKVLTLLLAVRPYLIIKQNKADDVIAFIKNTDWSKTQSDATRLKRSAIMRELWASGRRRRKDLQAAPA